MPQDRDPRHGNAPFFGIQMAPDCEGNIKLGDPVFISLCLSPVDQSLEGQEIRREWGFCLSNVKYDLGGGGGEQ